MASVRRVWAEEEEAVGGVSTTNSASSRLQAAGTEEGRRKQQRSIELRTWGGAGENSRAGIQSRFRVNGGETGEKESKNLFASNESSDIVNLQLNNDFFLDELRSNRNEHP